MQTVRIGVPTGLNPEVALTLKAELIAAGALTGVVVDVKESALTLRQDAPDARISLGDKKITALNSLYELEKEGVAAVVIPGVRLQPYLQELQNEVTVPVVPLFAKLNSFLKANDVKKIALLGTACCSCYLKNLIKDIEVIEPNEEITKLVAEFEDEETGLIKGLTPHMQGIIKKISDFFVAQGAQMLVPANAQVARFAKCLILSGIPVVDIYEIVARDLLGNLPKKLEKPFKVGMIGGLGPAATVDLYDKIVKATPAKNDQEHFKLVVEQNPQIPDRTACLLGDGEDPTLAMYGCAKRLENDGCDCLIIPCNTAHAFIPYLERHLKIPFINMQQATMEEIYSKFGKDARIGLLATSGTVKTGIYSKKAESMGLAMFTPDEHYQERVMAAIYGPQGAKAGFTTGVCHEDLVSAAQYLVETYDCNCLILGCTELPLILHECDDFECAGKKVSLIDPTSALARKVVKLAEETNKVRGTK